MKTFTEWLISESLVTKLAIFDFDKTLAKTAEKPKGWKAPKGDVSDWWRHPESLTEPHYGGLNDVVLKAFQVAKADPNTHAVLLTGRSDEASHLVRKHLQDNQLFGRRMIPSSNLENSMKHSGFEHPFEDRNDSHEEYYKGDWFKEPDYPANRKGPIQDTLVHKKYIIEKLTKPEIQLIDFWEDRDDHIPEFLDLFKRMILDKPNLQQVIVHHVQPDGIKEIPLTKESINF